MADAKKTILTRAYLVYACMCLFGIAIIYRVFQLQFVQGSQWKSKADSLMIAYVNIQPVRGNIYTCDGSLLATSVPVYDLRMDMKTDGITDKTFFEKIDSLSFCISNLFKDKSKEEYKRILKQARKDGERYFLFARNVSYKDLKTIRTFPIFNRGRYKGGLIVEQHNIRQKPFRDLAQRTIGYKMKDIAPVGLEGSFDKFLAGESGKRLMQKISGNVWKPVNDEDEIESKDGCDVTSTIDLNIQDVAEQSLLNQLQKNEAEAGCAVLMEVATGQIKAIANLKRSDDGTYHEDFNYAVGYGSEPGSTFKLASVMAGIEDGYIDINENVDCNGGQYTYAPHAVIHDSHEGMHLITVQHAFEISSNVGISRIIAQYYKKNPQQFIDRLHKMHFGDELKLQISGEALPRIKNTTDKDWSKVSLPYISIGYESRLSPLNMLTFYNAVANNGRMVKPQLVKEITYRGGVVKKFSPEIIADTICSPKTIAIAKKLLEGVVERGTASKLNIANYKIAGKTGTAQVANSTAGYKNGKTKYQASFVGYFPAQSPAYSCIVVVYNPAVQGYYAADVAMPVFKDIADKVFSTNLDMHKELQRDSAFYSHLPVVKNGLSNPTTRACTETQTLSKNLNDGNEWTLAEKGTQGVNIKPTNFREGIVPNVIGMGLRDAVYLLETRGLQVKVVGRGAVNKQSIATGTKISRGELITIELS